MSKRGRSFLAIVAALILVVVIRLNRDRLLLAVGNALLVEDELRPADVIHVISGPDYRTDYAIQLFKQGYGKKLFFTGGWCPEIQGNHAERGVQRATAQGLPLESLVGDGTEVHSTYAEALRLKGFLAASPQPVKTVMVVSDPYHMRRSAWTYRQVLGQGVRIQMAPVPFASTPYQRRWWTDDASTQYVRDEFLKIVYYHLRYRLTSGPVQAWLATLDRD